MDWIGSKKKSRKTKITGLVDWEPCRKSGISQATALWPVILLSVFLFFTTTGCGKKEEPVTAPNADEGSGPALRSVEKPPIFTDEQLASLREAHSQGAVTSTSHEGTRKETTSVDVSINPEKPEEEMSADDCEKAREWVTDQYTYVSFRKFGDQISGSIYDNYSGEETPLSLGADIGEFRVALMTNRMLRLEAPGCEVILEKSATIPTPKPPKQMSQEVLLKCGATIQHMRLIADAMQKYFDRNGLYPAPENEQRQPLKITDPQAPIEGFFPKEMVQRDVYLRTLPRDPFSEKQAQPYRYACIPTEGWVVIGNGPDGDADIKLSQVRFLRRGDFKLFLDTVLPDDAPLYDPANGAESNGDIVVWGPQGDVTLKDEQLIKTAQSERK